MDDNLENFFMSMEMMITPKMADAHIIPNKTHPTVPPISTRESGVYVPAIRKKMEQ